MDHETIAALSTPLGRAGIAVLRITGPGTADELRKIIPGLPAKMVPRRAYHGFVVDRGKKIDECLVVFFKAPRSYTGEDLAEISIHSNPFLVETVLELIVSHDVRSALPGEFTYRAYKNGKLDLIQAESVNELINANSAYFAEMKFAGLEGRLSGLIGEVKENLVLLGIKIETRIEFEEDQFFDEIPILEELGKTLGLLRRVLENSRFNEVLNKGLNVVIVGQVNVGKSSLFNTLLSEDRAIISAIPGTTRDYLKEKLYIEGLPLEITDVAGINRDVSDEIEAAGIRRSLEKITGGDAVIFMLDASREPGEADLEIYDLVKDKRKIIVLNKMDIAGPGCTGMVKSRFPGEEIIEISVKEHRGLDGIRSFLGDLVRELTGREVEITVNRRQKLHLEKLAALLSGIDGIVRSGSQNIEIVAEEIRRAMQVIGELTGEITPDDILDGIFSQFCVGK